MITAVLIAVIALPWLWCAAVAGVDRMAPDARPDDRTEKRYLMILLAPVALGAAAVACAHWLPMSVDSSGDLPFGQPTGSGVTVWQMLRQWLPLVVLIIYGIGLAVRAVPLARQFLALHRIVSRAQPSTLAKDVRLADADVPPLSWGRGIVLLPQSLVARLPAAQVELLIAHERAHIKRGDVAWYAVLSWIDAFLWYNPFVRRQTARCRLAAELACDRAVTRMAPEEREVYAACLLAALKHASGAAFCAPAGFSATHSAEARLRMTEILTPASPRAPVPSAPFTAILLILPLLALQYAWSQAPSQAGSVPSAPECGNQGPACLMSADTITITDAKGTATASGHAELRIGGKTYRADKIHRDGKTGRIGFEGPVATAEGTATNSLVKTIKGISYQAKVVTETYIKHPVLKIVTVNGHRTTVVSERPQRQQQ